jgi:hypothetical protein
LYLLIAGQAAHQSYDIDDAVTVANKQNLEIAIARKQIRAAPSGFVEACSVICHRSFQPACTTNESTSRTPVSAMRIITFRVLEEELKTQQERLKSGTVGTLNVERKLRPPT